MRVALQDPLLLKFSRPLKESWEARGHRVDYRSTYDPRCFSEYDVTLVESAEEILALADQERPRKRGKLFVRVIDVDAYMGAMTSIHPDYVDGVIFIAKHIQDLCNRRYENLPDCAQHLIPLGVDLDACSYRGALDGHRIGFVSTQLSEAKGFDTVLQLAARLAREQPDAELHVVGEQSGNVVWLKYVEHLVEMGGLEDRLIWRTHWPGEIAEFWRGMSHMILPSKKEAFSLVTAECMAIGVKPVVNSFWGAAEIWPGHILFQDPVAAYEMLATPNERAAENREFVAERYDLKRHVEGMNRVLGL
jgi:glycosyltransferase involved in cell wall biosynthesis